MPSSKELIIQNRSFGGGGFQQGAGPGGGGARPPGPPAAAAGPAPAGGAPAAPAAPSTGSSGGGFAPRPQRPGGRFQRPDRNAFSGPRVNHRIRVSEVRVVGPEGEMLGVMSTSDALRLAREKDLDLVEVNPKGVPPVCKVMDFGKFKYEEKKREADTKRRQVQFDVKEIKLRPKTDDGDMDTKTKHIRRFLEEGHKVKVTCRFRGREITHPETAEHQLIHFMEHTRDIAIIEQTPRMEAKTMTIILTPKPEVRAKVAQQHAKRIDEEKKKSKLADRPAGSEPEDDEDDDDNDDDDVEGDED